MSRSYNKTPIVEDSSRFEKEQENKCEKGNIADIYKIEKTDDGKVYTIYARTILQTWTEKLELTLHL